MRIGEVGKQVGVDSATIRYYESLGLMPEPSRAASGYRDYDQGAVDRLRFVRDAQATGLSLSEIGSILEMRDNGERTCDHITGLLERHVVEIERQIEVMTETKRALGAMLERASSLDPAACVEPNRCQTIEAALAPESAGHLAGRHIHGAVGHQ